MSSEGVKQCNEPQAHPERCGCELEVPVGYVSGERFHAEHERLRECRKERNALSAELAALKAASGEEVEVVAWRNFDGEGGYDFTEDEDLASRWTASNGQRYPDWCAPLMTVAQHQRITAALRGEVERLNRDAKNDAIAYKAAIERQEELRAELDAIRKQEPIQVVAVATMRSDGDGGVEPEWLLEGGTAELMEGMVLVVAEDGRLTDEYGSGIVYAAPPAAAMDGGMVGVPAKLIGDAVKHLTDWLDLHECECENGHICGRGHVRATRDRLATHRQASQQEGE